MADEYIHKSFDGGAQTTTLTAGFTAGGATLAVANGTSFPDGSSGPFVVVVDRGLATEEKFLIDTTSGTSNVTFTIQQAGYDGTSAINHNAGATVDHCLDAYTVEQANRYVNLQSTKGSLVTHTGSTSVALAASGTNNLTLLTDSTTANGIKWGQIVEATIATGAVSLAKLATAVQNLLVPAGTISATVSATEADGWKFMGQTLTNAEALYPSLFAVAPAGWRTGTAPNRNLVLPSITDKTLFQAGTTALGSSGGSATITQGNLPAHVHTVNPPNTNVAITDPGHNHTVTNGTLVVREDGGGDAKLTANSSYGPYNTYTVSNVGNTTGISATVDIAEFNSGSIGSGTAYYQPHLAVNYQIKVH
jgi:hypothetical protein